MKFEFDYKYKLPLTIIVVALSVWMLIRFNKVRVTKYYVVRHAEKADDSQNPHLSEAGIRRSYALRDTLINKGIDAIFVSQLFRTQETADSLARELNEQPTQYSTGNIDLLIAALKETSDKRILVVSHGGMVEQIVGELSGENIPAIGADDFDNLFIVTVEKSVFFVQPRRSLIKSTYGAPSPAAANGR